MVISIIPATDKSILYSSLPMSVWATKALVERQSEKKLQAIPLQTVT